MCVYEHINISHQDGLVVLKHVRLSCGRSWVSENGTILK